MYTINVNIALTNPNHLAFLLMVNSQITSEQITEKHQISNLKKQKQKALKITKKISRIRFGQTIVYEARVGGTLCVKW